MRRRLTRGAVQAARPADSDEDERKASKSDLETSDGSSSKASDTIQSKSSSRSRASRNVSRRSYKESRSSSSEGEEERTSTKDKSVNTAREARATIRTRTRASARTLQSSRSSGKSSGIADQHKTINSFFQKKSDTKAPSPDELLEAERRRENQVRRMDRSAKDMKRKGRRQQSQYGANKGTRTSHRNASRRTCSEGTSDEESSQSDSESQSESVSGISSDDADEKENKSVLRSESVSDESGPGPQRKRAKVAGGGGDGRESRATRSTRTRASARRDVKSTAAEESAESSASDDDDDDNSDVDVQPERRSARDRQGKRNGDVKPKEVKGDRYTNAKASAGERESESESESENEGESESENDQVRGKLGKVKAKKSEPIVILSSDDEPKTSRRASKGAKDDSKGTSTNEDEDEEESSFATVRSNFKRGLKGMTYSAGRRTTRSQDSQSVAIQKAKAEKAKAIAEQQPSKARRAAQLARTNTRKTATARARSVRQKMTKSNKGAYSESEESQSGSQGDSGSGGGSDSGTGESDINSSGSSNSDGESEGDSASSASPVKVTRKRKLGQKKRKASSVRALDLTKINNGFSKSGRVKVSNLKNESSSSEDSEGYFVEEDKWYETVTDPPPKQPKEMRLSELYIEKVLDSKKNEDTSKSSVFQLKFHGLSYHNLRWVTQEDLIKNFKSGKQRVRNFLEKDSGSTFYEPGQAFNPAYLHVDRVIQHHRPKGLSGKIWYLVKWNGLDYEKATWESSTDLQDADSQQAVKLYRKRNIVSRVKVQDPLAYRSKSPVYQVIEESPKDFPEPYKLLDYQLEGLNWMVWQWHQNRNCILADEMGLGKTVQSVAFIHHLHVTLKLAGPFLVVAPLSTIGHWLREFETWTDLNVVLIKGSSTNRRVIKETELFHRRDGKVDKKQYKFDVILTTYEYALQESTLLKAIRFTTCILDEAHRLKNVDCKLQNQLREYKFMHQVLLTGTPLQNSVNEIWALLNYMDEPRFPDLEDFLDDFGDVKSDTDVKKLQDVLHKYMLRREKRDVKKEIPQKKETIVQVELTSIQKRYYRAILERNLKVLAQGTSLPNLNNISMELRKCCIHPYLITGCEDSVVLEEKCDTPEKRDQALIHASGKMVLVDKLLKKLKAGGHKVLIFSQMTKCLDILQDYLEAANYNFERLDGNTGGEARQQAIDRYSRKDSDGFVFLLSTKAGGVGINLTAADTVIIYDSDWNPQNDVQAQARVHRIGQKSKVEIYRLITHNTYEEEMFKKASMKLGLEQAVMGNMSKDSKPGLSNKKMIEELVKKGAYGTLMDENDTEGNKFSAETIDEILEKRATVVVMEDDTEQGASSFAKARFEVKDTISDLNVDDPEFWTKWAQRQNMDINKLMKESEDENIVYGARKRKKPTYYQMTHAPGSAKAKRGASRGAERGSDSNDQDFDSDSSSSGESYSGASSVDEMSEKKIKISRTTIRTEKDALLFEKALQRYGWGRWREIRRDCPKLCGNWSDFQIAAIAQEILLIAVDSKTASNDSSMVSFVKRICSEFTKQHQPAPPAQPTSHIQKTSVPIARMSTDAMPHGKSRGPVAAGVTAGGVGVTITSSVPPNMINGVAAIVNPHADSTTANPATNATTDAQALPPTQAQTVPSQHPQPHPSTHTSPILIEQANSSISLQTPPIPLSPSTTEPALAGATAIVAPVSYRPVHMQWIDTYKPLTVAAGELRKISKYRKRLHTGTIAVRLFNQLMYADWMNNTLTHRALWGKPYTMDNQLHEITLGPMLHFSPKTYKMEVCPFAEKWWRDATYDDKVCAVAMARHGYATQKVVVSNVLEDPGLGKLLASTVMKVLNKSMMASDADEPQPSTLIHELDFDHKKELEAEFMSILKHGNSSLLAHHNKRRAADRKESLAEKEARAQKELKVKAKKEKLVAVPPGNPDHWKLKDQKAFYNTAAAYGIPSTTTETKPSTSTSATTALSSTDTKAESGETPTIHVETTDSIDTNKPEEKPAPQEKEAENTEPPAVRDEKLEQDVEMSQAEVAQSLPLPTPTPDTTGNASTNTTAPISLHGDRVGGLKGGSKSPKTEEGAALAGAVGWTWTWAEFRKMAELNCTDDAVIRFWKEYKAMCEAVAAEDDQPLAATNALSGSDMDTGSPSLKEPSLASAVDEKCPPAQTINLTTPSEQPSEYIKSTAECIVASSTEPDPESKQSHKDPYTTISSLETVTTRDVPLQAAPATDHTDIQAPVPTNNNGINTTAKHFAKPKQDKTTLLWPGQFAVHKVSPYKAKALLERAALMDQLRTVVLVEPTLKHIISRIPTSGIKRFAQWFEKGADDIALYTAVAQHGWDVPHTTVLDMHKDAFKAGRKQVKSLQQVDAVTKNGLNGDCWQKLAHWPSRTDIMKRLRNIIDAIRLHRKLSSEGGIKRKTTLEFLPIRTKKPASVHLKKQSCLDFTKANSMSDHSDEEFQEPSKPLSSIESKSTISAKPAKRRKSSSSAVDCELIDMTSESPSSSADNMSKNRLSSTTSNSFPVKSTDGKTALKYKIATATQRSGDSKLSTKSSKGLKPDYKTASSEGSGADSVGIHSSKILSINSAVLNKSSTSMGAKDIKATKRTLTSRKRPEASINSSMPNGSKKAKRSEKNITLMSMFKKKPHVEVVDSSDEDGPLCVPTCYSPSPPNLY